MEWIDKMMSAFQVLVHVSTAYCHCQENTLDETVKIMSPSPNQLIEALKYENPIQFVIWDDLQLLSNITRLLFVRWMDDETVRLICPTLLEGRPNTYTYTKALAESLLKTEVSNLPIAIVRPSIINATWKEPVPVRRFFQYFLNFFLQLLKIINLIVFNIGLGRLPAWKYWVYLRSKYILVTNHDQCSPDWGRWFVRARATHPRWTHLV